MKEKKLTKKILKQIRIRDLRETIKDLKEIEDDEKRTLARAIISIQNAINFIRKEIK